MPADHAQEALERARVLVEVDDLGVDLGGGRGRLGRSSSGERVSPVVRL